MSNLQKFNTILEDFDKEVGKLKAVSKVYQSMQDLLSSFDEISKRFNAQTFVLEKISERQKLESEKISKSLIGIEQSQNHIKEELVKIVTEKTNALQSEQQLFFKKLEVELSAKLTKFSEVLSDIKNANEKSKIDLSKLIEERTDQIRKENKEFYKEFESTIKIKLDDNRSEIKQLIENERTRIKEIFEIEFAKNTKELRLVIESETNKQTQTLLDNQKVIKLSVWVIGGILLILGTLTVFNLLEK